MKLAIAFLFLLPAFGQQPDDVVLRAMRDEMARIAKLGLANVEAPYYADYTLDDSEQYRATASLGGLIESTRSRFRLPRVQVRVGSPKLDNTNYFGGGFSRVSQYDLSEWPLDDNYGVLRQQLWLATDRAFKSAADAIAKKKAALQNVTVSEALNDFAPAEGVVMIRPVKRAPTDDARWIALVRGLSSVFTGHPAVTNSAVDFEDIQTITWYMNTNGTQVRTQDRVSLLRVRAEGLSPEGAHLHDATVIQELQLDRLPAEADLRREVEKVANNIDALARAPVGETYAGPVLFEETAAAQLFAQLLGNNLSYARAPVTDPNRPVPVRSSELEGRIGSKVLPEWMDVVDDATQKGWQGQPLFGYYPIDMEGVVPKPVSLVEKGVLKGYLMTRQPVPGFEGSNGHARLPGQLGNMAARVSNLFVRATQTESNDALKKRLLDMCKQRGKPYGLIVRKLDFPASAPGDELRRLLMRAQSSGASRPVSSPVLVYRVYQDGREELVRGLRFRGMTARSMKDILAASDRTEVFDYLDNGYLFAMMGVGGYVANCSVIAPGVLIDDVELERPQEDVPVPPLVPPPPAVRAALK